MWASSPGTLNCATAKDSMNAVKGFGQLADLLYREVQQTAAAYGASRVVWVCDQC